MYSPYSALLRDRFWGGVPISLFALGVYGVFFAMALYLLVARDTASKRAWQAYGIAALDNDWRLVYANPVVGRLLGRDTTNLMGRTLDQLLDLAADDPFRVAYRDSKQAGEPLTFTKYSEIFSSWIDVRGYPHPGGYTILFRLQGAKGPVSQELLDSERQREVTRSINQRIFDTSLDLILVVDRQG